MKKLWYVSNGDTVISLHTEYEHAKENYDRYAKNYGLDFYQLKHIEFEKIDNYPEIKTLAIATGLAEDLNPTAAE